MTASVYPSLLLDIKQANRHNQRKHARQCNLSIFFERQECLYTNKYYFSRHFGLMAFMDNATHTILHYDFVRYETCTCTQIY